MLHLVSFAQTITPIQKEQALSELVKRGISEDDFRAKMQERGIDIDNLSQEQLLTLQPVIEEVVQEIEAENAAKAIKQTVDETASKSSVEISQAVEAGSSIKEAVSEELIENAAQDLPPEKIYGQEIFRNKSLKLFRTTNDVKPPDAYLLGSGDKIAVSIWGISQGDFSFEINKDGYIKPSGLPRIFLKGIPYGKARQLIQKRFAQAYVFQPEQFSVSIQTARTININIFGEVFNYGSFTISATNTAFNALVAAGGPTDIGSLRNIRLIRGEETRILDVYDFMFDPAVQYDFYLADNDLLYVPIAEKVVSISGAVKRPFKYELTKQEGLLELIKFAGGTKDNAYLENIQIKRIADGEEVLIDVNWKDLLNQKRNFTLFSGDEITVRTIPGKVENVAEIIGAVDFPGTYDIVESMRVTDLLSKGVIQKEARLDVAFLLRKNLDNTHQVVKINLLEVMKNPDAPGNVVLKAGDQLTVYRLDRYIDKANIQVTGAVRNPLKYPWDVENGIKVADAIILAGGLSATATDFAYIYRTDVNNPEKRSYQRVNIKNAIENPLSEDNVALAPFDEVKVLSTTYFTDVSNVSISGAVRNPGEYRYDPSLTLKDVLTLAGGLKLEAASNKIEIFRVEFNDNNPTRTIAATLEIDRDLNLLSGDAFLLQPYDQIVVRAVPEFEFQEVVYVEGQVPYPGPYALTSPNMRLSDVLDQAGGLLLDAFPEGAYLTRREGGVGVVITRLEEVLSNPNSKYNYVLKKGDVIKVPKENDIVTILTPGTKAQELYKKELVNTGKINVPLSQGKRANWYLREYAVGVKKLPKKSSYVVVEYPNGEIKRTKDFALFKVYPKPTKGSVIHVGYHDRGRLEKEKRDKKPVDWEKVVANTLAQATAVITLVVLVQRLQ